MIKWPIAHLHPIFLSTTIISIGDNIGTGFFFNDKDKTYLITNKHVILDFQSNKKPIDDHITIRLHTDKIDYSKNEKLLINLFDSKGNKKWLEHVNPEIDIVIIPLDLDAKFVLRPLNRSFIEETEDLVVQFDKLLIVGYPHGWYDDVYNFPIIRIGHLSSPFKFPFRGEQPTMIGDITTHEGMSGGPALILLENPMIKDKEGHLLPKIGKQYILAGVYSAHFGLPGTNECPNLVNIWFSELILEILDNQGKE